MSKNENPPPSSIISVTEEVSEPESEVSIESVNVYKVTTLNTKRRASSAGNSVAIPLKVAFSHFRACVQPFLQLLLA